MTDDAIKCQYCMAPLQMGQTRCSECGSWLNWRAHVLYPGTLWALVGLLLAVVAAAIAMSQAADARAERRATEALRRDIGVVAANVTKMAFIVADGSGRFGGFPDVHLAAIKRYEEAIRPYLTSGLDAEIENTIQDLNEQIRRRNQRQ